jgi:hypothetical protein
MEALKQNKTLISLNLGNNKLDGDLGKELRNALEVNKNIIDLEFGFNSFNLKDVSLKTANIILGPLNSRLPSS